MFEFATWIETYYPLPCRVDPIATWTVRASQVRAERNPHTALKKCRDFMTQTGYVRAALDEAHAGVEQYIDTEIDRMRGN